MRYQVPPEAGGLTLGRFLYDRLRLSRNLVRRAKNSDGLLVDGQAARVSQRLVGGEWVEIQVREEARVQPEPAPLTVIYEDDDLLVVEKPAGMVVHPVKDYVGGTLANAVAHHLRLQGGEGVTRPVLRIDRGTSGLVLFGKTPVAAQRLATSLEQHKLERLYLGMTRGRILPDAGVIELSLRRVWGHPVAREAAVGSRTPEQERLLAEAAEAGKVLRGEWTGAGQRAVTHYRVIRRWNAATMLELRLETGRTHQIRVHLSHIGHPLLGDPLYGVGGPPGRQALHAASLTVTHPTTGALLRFGSPLPEELRRLVEELDREEV